jgi:putative component of membrane protein insertase Oxa1/YidC/SpoIIIJ protein YidD
MSRAGVRRTIVALSAVAALVAILDLRRAPGDQLTTRAALGLIHVYQATLSPLYDRMGVQCRFTPTCSHYGETCIRQFGLMRGGPWTPAGTVDPPPPPLSITRF